MWGTDHSTPTFRSPHSNCENVSIFFFYTSFFFSTTFCGHIFQHRWKLNQYNLICIFLIYAGKELHIRALVILYGINLVCFKLQHKHEKINHFLLQSFTPTLFFCSVVLKQFKTTTAFSEVIGKCRKLKDYNYICWRS